MLCSLNLNLNSSLIKAELMSIHGLVKRKQSGLAKIYVFRSQLAKIIVDLVQLFIGLLCICNAII